MSSQVNCRHRELMQDWLDSRNEGSAPAEVAAHLRDCEPCRSFVRSWNALETDFGVIRTAVPPATLQMQMAVRDRIDEESKRSWVSRVLPSVRRYGFASAAFATAAAILWMSVWGPWSSHNSMANAHSTDRGISHPKSDIGAGVR